MRRHDSPFPSTIFSSLYGRGINKFYSVCQLFYITPPFAEDAGRGTNVFYPVCRPFCITRPFAEETIRGTREVLYITPSVRSSSLCAFHFATILHSPSKQGYAQGSAMLKIHI